MAPKLIYIFWDTTSVSGPAVPKLALPPFKYWSHRLPTVSASISVWTTRDFTVPLQTFAFRKQGSVVCCREHELGAQW